MGPATMERKYARMARSYAALKSRHERLVRSYRVEHDDLVDARRQIRRLTKQLADRERAGKGSLGRLMAVVGFAANRLYDSGEVEAAAKLEMWRETMTERLQPVVDVEHLVELLEEWVGDGDKSAVYLKTMAKIDELRGHEHA